MQAYYSAHYKLYVVQHFYNCKFKGSFASHEVQQKKFGVRESECLICTKLILVCVGHAKYCQVCFYKLFLNLFTIAKYH